MPYAPFHPPIEPPPPGAHPDAWMGAFDLLWPDRREEMAQTPQDPIHHAEGDVWTHTKMVVGELLAQPLYAQSSPTERFVMWAGAMAHDVAKTYTTAVGEDGRVSAGGHSKKGAIDARLALWRLGLPWDVREEICALVLYHQMPFYAFKSRDNLHPEYIVRKMSLDVRLDLLCAVARADMKGRVCPDQKSTLDDIDLFEALTQELQCHKAPYSFPNPMTASRYVLSRGAVDPDTAVFDDKTCTVWMTSGLPASGKSSWRESKDLPCVSYDDIRKKLGARHGDETGKIVHAAHDLAREYLRKHQDFIWDATHLSQSMRQPALNLIRQYNAKPTLVCVESNQNSIMARNSQRGGTLKNSDITNMMNKWEFPLSWEADAREVFVSAAKPKFGL